MLSVGFDKISAVRAPRSRSRALLPPNTSKAKGVVDVVGYAPNSDLSNKFSRLWGDEYGVSLGLEKSAFTSPHTAEKKVQATPKKHGGRDGRYTYQLKFHPAENRWSCTCKDWKNRRRYAKPEETELHDCKHIRAHNARTKPWLLEPRKYPREFLDRQKKERERHAEQRA